LVMTTRLLAAALDNRARPIVLSGIISLDFQVNGKLLSQ